MSKILIDRDVLEQALEALNLSDSVFYPETKIAIAKLRAALEQPNVSEPVMTHIAQRKLDSLIRSGFEVSGYSIYHQQKHQHGFVTTAGLVGWWRPEGAEYPQPQVEQEPVAWEGRDGYLYHFIEEPKPGDRPLCTHPQPPRQPLTDAQINDHRLALAYDSEDLPDPWDFKQGVRAAERAHGIGGEK